MCALTCWTVLLWEATPSKLAAQWKLLQVQMTGNWAKAAVDVCPSLWSERRELLKSQKPCVGSPAAWRCIWTAVIISFPVPLAFSKLPLADPAVSQLH